MIGEKDVKLKLLTLALGLATAGAVMAAPAQAGNNSVQQAGNNMGVTIGTYAPYTWQMMSNYSPVGREMYILKNRQSGHLANHALYFGGYAKANAMLQIASKKPGAFVNPAFFASNNTGARNLSNIQLTDISLLMTADINQWTTVYMQLGDGLIGGPATADATVNGDVRTANIANNRVQFQQGYVLMGDLSQKPVYGFIGKKDIDFGYFGSVNMFAQPLNRELFAAVGNTVGVGYMQHGLDVVLSAMNGGTNGTNLYTSNSGAISNFAVNASYGNQMKGVDWRVGAGYLNGINGEFARTYTTTTTTGGTVDVPGKSNGAWDINGQLAFDNFDILGEYTSSTNKSAQSLDSNKTVKAWNIGMAYNFPFMGRKSKVSFSYSQAQGINPTFGKSKSQNYAQYVVGFRNEFMPNVWGGVSYAYNNGVLISLPNGGQGDAAKPMNNMLIGNSDVDNNTILLDLTAAF